MNNSTMSAPSIVGHTTISNPSWTAILTGAWDNKTGVINNVFTPRTYDRWPSVFSQLETARCTGKYQDEGDRRLGRHRRHLPTSGDGADEVIYIAQTTRRTRLGGDG